MSHRKEMLIPLSIIDGHEFFSSSFFFVDIHTDFFSVVLSSFLFDYCASLSYNDDTEKTKMYTKVNIY